MLHRTRHLFIRQQTAVINAIRAHLAEFGVVAPVGCNGVEALLEVIADPNDKRVPEVARSPNAAVLRQSPVTSKRLYPLTGHAAFGGRTRSANDFGRLIYRALRGRPRNPGPLCRPR